MFLWSFFLAPSFLVHMARVIPFLKTPTFVRSGFCQIYPHSVISSNSVKYFIAVESRRICKNLYIFCYCCWAQNWRLSFHLFKAKNYIEFLNWLGIVVRGGDTIKNPIRLQYAILIFCDGSFCHTFFPVGFRVNFFSKTILFLNDKWTHSPLSKRNVLTFLKFAHLHQF